MILAHPQKCVACHLCEGACSFQHEPIVFHNPSANVYRKLLLEDGRIVGAVVIGRAEHVQDLGVVQAMIRRRTDVSRWRHMLHGERINYGMLAFESAKR